MKKVALIFLQPVTVNPLSQQMQFTEFQEKFNSFYCQINENDFTPGCDLVYKSPQLYGGYSNNFSIVRVTAKRTEKHPHKHLIIELNKFHGLGEYSLSDISNDCRYEEFFPDNIYKSTLTKYGKVIITKDDRVNFLLSGSFEFTAANTTNRDEEAIISKGFFNIKV